MTRLILIRHGQTEWNAAGRYQGQVDLPLNALGRQQAEQIVQQLDGTQLAAIYASDLARARETAEVLARATGLQVQLDRRLREIEQGEWEGMPFTEIQRRYPRELEQRRENPLGFVTPGGESIRQVRQRVLEAAEEICRRHPNDTVAIVSHGVALAILRAHYQHLPIERMWDLVPANGEVTEVEA